MAYLLPFSRLTVLCLILSLFLQFSLFASLAQGTKVLTPSGLIPIEKLEPGMTVIGYNKSEQIFVETKIKASLPRVENQALILETASEFIYVSQDHLFYDQIDDMFKEALLFNNQSIFLSQILEPCKCYGVHIPENIPPLFYEIILEEPHTFFISEALILTHNFAPATLPALAPVIETALSFGTAVACVYINKQTQLFKSAEQVKNQIFKEVEEFCRKYYKNNKPIPQSFLNTRRIVPYQQTSPKIAGIPTNTSVYNDMLNFPLHYGPIYPLGKISSTGDVDCILLILTFNGCGDDGHPLFIWQELGRSPFKRTDPFVKMFIETEDKNDIKKLRDLIKTWPASVRKHIFKTEKTIIEEAKALDGWGVFDQTFYESIFGIHALYQLAEKEIPPSLIVHALKNGTSKQGKNSNVLICFDTKKTIAFAVEKDSKRIINVDRYNNYDRLDEKDKTPTNLDNLNENDQNHILNGSPNKKNKKNHNWEKLSPLKKWEEVKEIIREVIETGAEVSRQGDKKIKTKVIRGYLVKVTYNIAKTGFYRISNGWIV